MDVIWQEILQGIREDFSDLPTAAEAVRISIRLVLAALLGGALGYQREQVGKEAGLRTHMLVSLGAAFFVLIPQQAGMPLSALSRVIEGIIVGIGFLGAGAILKRANQEEIRGLTTAAGIWLTAAIGMAAGMGREASAVLGTILAFVILASLVRVEQWRSGALADKARTPPESSGE
jgi:putative Mg2+ transporter-C (MgtC) family protein